MSVPSAIGSMCVASATAAPPLLPPQVLLRSCGLSVAPNTGLNVCDPAPNSGVLVLPTQIAPACRSRSTVSESSAGHEVLEDRRSERRPDPVGRLQILVRDRQAVQRTDVVAVRVGVVGQRARSIACSATSVTMALRPGFMRSICVRCAPTTSRAERSLARMRRASSTALRPQMLTAREILQRGGDAAAGERHAGRREPHLDAAERAGEHEVVEVAEMADAEDLAFQLAEPRAERHVEPFEHDLAKRVGIVTVRHHDRGQRAAVFPRARQQQLEPPRARPRGASPPRTARAGQRRAAAPHPEASAIASRNP